MSPVFSVNEKLFISLPCLGWRRPTRAHGITWTFGSSGMLKMTFLGDNFQRKVCFRKHYIRISAIKKNNGIQDIQCLTFQREFGRNEGIMIRKLDYIIG